MLLHGGWHERSARDMDLHPQSHRSQLRPAPQGARRGPGLSQGHGRQVQPDVLGPSVHGRDHRRPARRGHRGTLAGAITTPSPIPPTRSRRCGRRWPSGSTAMWSTSRRRPRCPARQARSVPGCSPDCARSCRQAASATPSFGAPQFHPAVPWQALNQGTDFAMPQIYFEAFSFGNSDADEVTQCVAANKALPGDEAHAADLELRGRSPHAGTGIGAAGLSRPLRRLVDLGACRASTRRARPGTCATMPAPWYPPCRSIPVTMVQGIHHVLRKGAVGNDVVAVRTLLQRLGYPSSGHARCVRRQPRAGGAAIPDDRRDRHRRQGRPGDDQCAHRRRRR